MEESGSCTFPPTPHPGRKKESVFWVSWKFCFFCISVLRDSRQLEVGRSGALWGGHMLCRSLLSLPGWALAQGSALFAYLIITIAVAFLTVELREKVNFSCSLILVKCRIKSSLRGLCLRKKGVEKWIMFPYIGCANSAYPCWKN